MDSQGFSMSTIPGCHSFEFRLGLLCQFCQIQNIQIRETFCRIVVLYLLVSRGAGQVARDVLVEVAFESVLRPGEGTLVVEVSQDEREYGERFAEAHVVGKDAAAHADLLVILALCQPLK